MANRDKGTEVSLFGDKEESLPSYMQDDRGLGNENASGAALATPQIKLLQALSPELRSVDGAQVGQLYDNVSGQLYDSIIVANLYLEVAFTLWKKRDLGGGKEGEYLTEAEANAARNALDRPDDYIVQETHKHYLVQLDGESGDLIGGCIIYMKATQLSPSRAWNTEIVKKNGPRFASIWEVSHKMERSKRNEDYANYAITMKGWASQELYAALKPLYQAIVGQPVDTEAA
jgi:hypothetical protein